VKILGSGKRLSHFLQEQDSGYEVLHEKWLFKAHENNCSNEIPGKWVFEQAGKSKAVICPQ
jgi:hypothetical protein